jgi:hypothetical protein
MFGHERIIGNWRKPTLINLILSLLHQMAYEIKNEMGGVCSKQGSCEMAYNVLVPKRKEKKKV